MRRLRQLQEPPHRLRLRRRRPHLQLRQNNAAVKRRIRNKKKDGIPPKKVGLARAISKLGYCSRSRAAELIAAGRVKWNGAARSGNASASRKRPYRNRRPTSRRNSEDLSCSE